MESLTKRKTSGVLQTLREYVKSIARFFRDSELAIKLLEPMEYDALGAEATRAYYSEIHVFRIDEFYRKVGNA